MLVWKLMSAVAVATSLVACGGGGGGDSGPVTSTDTFQTRTALSNYITDRATLSASISGTSSGRDLTGSFTVTQGALVAGNFESVAALGKTITLSGSLTVNGTNIPLSDTSTEWFSSNYEYLGSSGGVGEYSVTSTFNVPPLTGKVGDTGVFYSTNRYSDSTKSTFLGTEDVSYVLEPDTAHTSIFKMIFTEKDSNGDFESNSTVSFRMSPDGTLKRVNETYLGNSMSYTATYN